MTEPGVYLSDVAGHLLTLKLNPVRVACISCLETCNMSDFKSRRDAEPAAKAFMAKHGALDRKIAENIGEIVSVYLDAKHLYHVTEPPFIFVPEPFDISPETCASLDIEPEKK